MKNLFKQNEEWFTFYDVEGNKIERKTEIRFDPLTGDSSRLVFDPGMDFVAPDYTEEAEQTRGSNCPFCPENIFNMTPLFPREIAKEGRITYGQATVFPNLFPYSKHNAVVVMSSEHYIRLDDFTTTMIKDAFLACQDYMTSVMAQEDKPLYASINWNYLPHSGGSIIHPHLHIVLSETPTNEQALFEEKQLTFKETHGIDYLTTLYQTEKDCEERWIFEHGDTAWVHAYAPKSHNDFLAIFPNKTSLDQMTEETWTHFAEGLQAVFSTLQEQGLGSFNMVLNFSNLSSPVHARLIPRLTLGGVGTSDINFFHTLHQEPLSYKTPEEITLKAQAHFSKQIQNK